MTSSTWFRGCPTNWVIGHRTWSIIGHSTISQRRLPRRARCYARAMTSQWYTNVNKARPRHAPTWRKAFKWTHFTTISKREWISTVIVYVYEVILSIHFHSIKWNYDNRIGESPWRSWCYLICIITRGLCSYNARLFNDDVTTIGASYWRRREFPNYARLHRGRMVC